MIIVVLNVGSLERNMIELLRRTFSSFSKVKALEDKKCPMFLCNIC